MDKSSHSSGDSSAGAAPRDDYLRHLNKLSHKISKPISKKPSFDAPPPPPPPPQAAASAAAAAAQAQSAALQAQPQHQPPVYNINKSDFRNVVQKLTGSPAHDRPAAPPPPPQHQLHQPKPASSRLQRIRPPPLAHVANRPLSVAPPLSPLPPLPAVHGAAESPVSAYMRYLHSSMASGGGGDAGQKQLVSPRWSNLAPPMMSSMMPPPPQMPPPSPPIPFGCLNSPHPLLSPSLLLSPSSGSLGFPQLPLSPTVPMSSPRWRGF